MAESKPPSLQFHCPQCNRPLEAPASEAGAHRRCPACQFVLVVPTADEVARAAAKLTQHEDYPYCDEVDPSTADRPSRRAYLPVTCPVCQTRINASLEDAGAEVDCPDCGTRVPVPMMPPPLSHEPRITPRSADVGAYELVEGDAPSPDDRVVYGKYVPVTCPLCRTLMQIPDEHIGRKVPCLDCGTPVPVLPPTHKPGKKPGAGGSGGGQGEYAMLEDVDRSPSGAAADRPTCVAVVCPVCSARLHATPDQVGQQIVCPDCGRPVRVSAPRTPLRPARPTTADRGEYTVLEGAGQPSAQAPAAFDRYIAVVCPVCGTRLHATAEHAGARIDCPDCGTAVAVPEPPPSLKPTPTPIAPPVVAPLADEREVEGLFARVSARLEAARREARRPEHPPPTHPFLQGILTFPIYAGSWQRWVGLSFGLGCVLLLVSGALSFAAHAPAGRFDFFPWLMSMLLTMLALLLGIIWFSTAAATLLTILQDTAYGYDRVENWPEANFLDWVFEGLYLVLAAAFGVIPGAVAGWALHSAGLSAPIAMPISAWLMLPILLLSMLDNATLIGLFSATVLRSLLRHFWAWAAFYLETGALVGVTGGLVLLLHRGGGYALLPLAAPPIIAAGMIYFRLLGRLAGICARPDSA